MKNTHSLKQFLFILHYLNLIPRNTKQQICVYERELVNRDHFFSKYIFKSADFSDNDPEPEPEPEDNRPNDTPKDDNDDDNGGGDNNNDRDRDGGHAPPVLPVNPGGPAADPNRPRQPPRLPIGGGNNPLADLLLQLLDQ